MAASSLDLSDAVVFLAAAGLVVPTVKRLKVSPVLGFLVVGVALGPHGAGQWLAGVPLLGSLALEDTPTVRVVAELGVVFLLFMIGLELSLERLVALRRLVFGLGGAQVLATALAIGGLAALFGNAPAAAVVLGACLALSSTAVVMQLLTESGRLGAPAGRAAFAVLLFQDLAVVPILVLVGALGAGHGDGMGVMAGIGFALGKAAIAILVIFALGRIVLRPTLRMVAAVESRELFLAAVLLAVIGTAAATEAAGLSLALGAFLAGLLLAETEFRHRVAVDLEPFKGLLLGLFFVSVGLGIDLARALADPLWLAASVIGLMAIKAALFYLVARLFQLPRAVALESALLLSQGGEFAFIVVGLAATLGLLPAATAQFMLLVVGFSLLLTPVVGALARRLAARIEAGEAAAARPPAEHGDLADHVIIVGFGRVGQAIGDILARQGVAYVAIDLGAQAVAAQRRAGLPVHQGDAARHDMLERLGAGAALALVVTMDDSDAATRVVQAARAAWPRLSIYARVRDEPHGLHLLAAGADHVTPETTEASLQLGEAVLLGIGFGADAARAIIGERREEAALRLEAAAPRRGGSGAVE